MYWILISEDGGKTWSLNGRGWMTVEKCVEDAFAMYNGTRTIWRVEDCQEITVYLGPVRLSED